MKRRNFLVLAAGLSSCGGREDDYIWKGILFGIKVSIRFRDADRAMSLKLAESALRAAQEVEAVCSLWDSNSELSRLNRDGELANPSADFLNLLEKSAELYRETQGLFDPSIHSYLEWAKKEYAAGSVPSEKESEKRRELVDFSRVNFSTPNRIHLPSGMALSLNAIAQGYVTDLVARSIAAKTNSALVNFGEYRVVGTRPFDIEVEDGGTLSVSHSLAVSSGGGQRLSATTSANHLINPRSGESPAPQNIVAVQAPEAWLADGLATVAALGGEIPAVYQNVTIHRWPDRS